MPQDGFMDIIENYEEKIPYIQETKTFLANGFTYGIFNDILQRLEKQHNFSCQLYIQNPRKWGKVVFHDNGSVDANGMLGEVFLGRADIAATSITITKSRLRYLDFLPPMATEVITIVVPTNAVMESLDYWLFASPLHINLWITILIAIIIMAVMKTTCCNATPERQHTQTTRQHNNETSKQHNDHNYATTTPQLRRSCAVAAP